MAAAESNEAKCDDVPCDENTKKLDEPYATTPRRQFEQYQFRAGDLLYYALSVSFFIADVATGEQRVYYTHTRIHMYTGCLKICD